MEKSVEYAGLVLSYMNSKSTRDPEVAMREAAIWGLYWVDTLRVATETEINEVVEALSEFEWNDRPVGV